MTEHAHSTPEAAPVALDDFLACYDATLRTVYGYLHRGCGGDRTLAEDLTQEVYAAALTAARAGRREVLATPWLVTVARNKLVDHFRRVEREQRKLSLVRTTSPGPADARVPTRDEAARLLRALPPAQRAAVALRYLDDLPVDQVAHRLGKSVKATESLLSRARETLRRRPPEDHDA